MKLVIVVLDYDLIAVIKKTKGGEISIYNEIF